MVIHIQLAYFLRVQTADMFKMLRLSSYSCFRVRPFPSGIKYAKKHVIKIQTRLVVKLRYFQKVPKLSRD